MTEAEEKRMSARIMLATQMRFWMERFNMDVKALASKTKLSTKTIYRIKHLESGASTDSIADLAGAFGIQPGVLLMPVPRDKSDE